MYGHCNVLIKRHDLNMCIVIGPGHGAPAVLANLFLEGALANVDKVMNPHARSHTSAAHSHSSMRVVPGVVGVG